jgi:Protein of unknown function (DUF2769)
MSDDRQKIIDDNKRKCICGPCPSYTECMRAEDQLLFCMTGKSPDCIFEKKGCICPTCPVRAVLGLKKAYYCIKGAEKEQQ